MKCEICDSTTEVFTIKDSHFFSRKLGFGLLCYKCMKEFRDKQDRAFSYSSILKHLKEIALANRIRTEKGYTGDKVTSEYGVNSVSYMTANEAAVCVLCGSEGLTVGSLLYIGGSCYMICRTCREEFSYRLLQEVDRESVDLERVNKALVHIIINGMVKKYWSKDEV